MQPLDFHPDNLLCWRERPGSSRSRPWRGPNDLEFGLSFYAVFAKKTENPELLMEAAEWWIREHELDHFEKAEKVKNMVQQIRP